MQVSPPPVTLADNPTLPLLAARPAHQPLLLDTDGPISTTRFLHDLKMLAAALPDHGYAFNLCRDRYHFLLGFCAVLLRGQVTLLPPNRNDTTLKNIARHYPDSYCLTDDDAPLPLRQHRVTSDSQVEPREAADIPAFPARQLAAIAFTSGSTGTPSPHPKYWGSLAATAQLLTRRFANLGPILATVPSQHMYGLEMTALMVLQGQATLLRGSPFYPADICSLMAEQPQPVTLVTTPAHLRSLIQPGLEPPRASRLISATAPLAPALASAAGAAFQAPVQEIYGCTEAGSIATRDTLTNSQWQLLEGIQLHQHDQHFAVTAAHLPEAAPLQDQLVVDTPPFFTLLGRQSDMVNVGGKRESLANLTLKLQQIEGIDDAVVFLPPASRRHHPRPAALVVSDLPVRTISASLAEQLDPVFVPRPIRKVAALPRNDTGKLTHDALHSLWQQLDEH